MIKRAPDNVRYLGQFGEHILTRSFTARDPKPTFHTGGRRVEAWLAVIALPFAIVFILTRLEPDRPAWPAPEALCPAPSDCGIGNNATYAPTRHLHDIRSDKRALGPTDVCGARPPVFPGPGGDHDRPVKGGLYRR
jgi:hypothetical protein